MPIYEYMCQSCRAAFQCLVMKKSEEKKLACPECGGERLKRLISRVAYHVSEGERIDSYDPSARQSESFYSDSRNIGLHAQKRAKEMGVDLGGSFENKLEKLRSDPGSVLRDSE